MPVTCSFCGAAWPSRNQLFKHLPVCPDAAASDVQARLRQNGRRPRAKVAIFFGADRAVGDAPPVSVALKAALAPVLVSSRSSRLPAEPTGDRAAPAAAAAASPDAASPDTDGDGCVLNVATIHPQMPELSQDPRVSSVCNVADASVDAGAAATPAACAALTARLTAALPAAIQVFGCVGVKGDFRAPFAATRRAYHYMLPYEAFADYAALPPLQCPARPSAPAEDAGDKSGPSEGDANWSVGCTRDLSAPPCPL